MSVTSTNKGSICVLTIAGEFAGEGVTRFRELAQQTLSDDGRDFIVDMRETAVINSEGLEALTWLRRASEDELGMVKLCAVPDGIKQILTVTRLSNQFEQLDILDQALTSFA